MRPRSEAEPRVDAPGPLERTRRFIQPAVAAAHGSVAPPLAVQDTTTRPHVVGDQERLQHTDTGSGITDPAGKQPMETCFFNVAYEELSL